MVAEVGAARGVLALLMRLKAPLAFYIEFVMYPLLAFGLAVGWCRSWSFVGLIALGALLFTFVEYWVHRIGLHVFFYHGDHEMHHKHPDAYVVFPFWYSTSIFFAFWAALPLPVFTGMVLGYCWFLYWHHILHHFDLNSWPRFVQRYALWHLKHHHDETVNFGIAIPLWDFLFLTHKKA
jgi:sterol desaturase/sphingolipid hydroxylase (fatty acid hydroxylase superfamily)